MKKILLFAVMMAFCCTIVYGAPLETGTTQPAAPMPALEGGHAKERTPPSPLTLEELHKKYPTYFRVSGSPDKREVALTFDDVPDPRYTSKILDILKQYNVKATFFVVGNRAKQYPNLVKRMVNEGHVVGNHSYDHPNFVKLSDAAFHDQVNKTQAVLKSLIGYEPALIRPPYGNVTEEQVKWLASQKMYIIFWNVDSLDWKGLTADQIVTNILGHARPGSIILQHGGGGVGEDLSGSVEALPRIIEGFRKEGIKMTTVPDLLGIHAKK
ncbi:polysaccharide deacetylase family protein [Paenibacillus larvae]